MNRQRVIFLLRVAIAIVAGCFVFRWAGAQLRSGEGLRFDIAFEIVIALLLYGLLVWYLVGIPLMHKTGEKIGGIYLGNESAMQIMPQYSVAEARVKSGRYAEAVEEYHKVIAQHPDDIYAHIKIAELALAHWQNVRLAELELISAAAKASSDDAKVLVAGKLADLYHEHMHDTGRAIGVLREMQTMLPNSKAAQRATERIASLDQVAAGNGAPTPPKKIAFRAADEETIRRRRGY